MKWILVTAMLLSVTMLSTNSEASAKKTQRKAASATEKNSFTDTIKKIRDDDEGVVVMFNKEPGSYYLRRDIADFDALREKIEEAFKAKKPVSVTFDGAQLNILEVK